MKRILLIVVLLVTVISCNTGQNFKHLNNTGNVSSVSQEGGITSPVTFQIIYDNYLKNNELKADWGFSVMVTGLTKTILFDTGTDPDIFLSNFTGMNLDASSIDYLVLSHEHGDHTGGIPGLAKLKKDIPAVIPSSFSQQFKNTLVKTGFEPLLVTQPAEICKDLFTSGEFSEPLYEHALVLNTGKGLVVMTGCSHPGIINMLRRIRSDFGKNVYMVFGGFHLMEKSDDEINSIIRDMKSMGVVKCGATHCTGDHQIEMFREAFGDDFVELGVGNTLIVE